MSKKLLMLGPESLASAVASMTWAKERVDDVEAAMESLRAGGYDAVLADLRHFDADAFDLVRTLFDAAGWPLPVVAVVDPEETPTALEAKRAGVAWVDERWLGHRQGEAVQICLERMVESAERRRELEAYEQRHERFLQAEKFAAVGLLAAEIAHEINNPTTFLITNLTVMMDYVDTLADFHRSLRNELAVSGSIDVERFESLEESHEVKFMEEDLESLLDRSLAGLDRIHQIVQDLRFFSGERRTQRGWVDVAGLVRAAANLVRHEARFRAPLVIEMPELPRIFTDPSRLSQVLLNLMVNAVQAVPPGRPDQNEVRVDAEYEGDAVLLRVSDTGEGVDVADLDRVFDAFFTTKEPGEGTGLGLAISRDIVRELGGEIGVESPPGKGATFWVRLPVEWAGE